MYALVGDDVCIYRGKTTLGEGKQCKRPILPQLMGLSLIYKFTDANQSCIYELGYSGFTLSSLQPHLNGQAHYWVCHWEEGKCGARDRRVGALVR